MVMFFHDVTTPSIIRRFTRVYSALPAILSSLRTPASWAYLSLRTFVYVCSCIIQPHYPHRWLITWRVSSFFLFWTHQKRVTEMKLPFLRFLWRQRKKAASSLNSSTFSYTLGSILTCRSCLALSPKASLLSDLRQAVRLGAFLHKKRKDSDTSVLSFSWRDQRHSHHHSSFFFYLFFPTHSSTPPLNDIIVREKRGAECKRVFDGLPSFMCPKRKQWTIFLSLCYSCEHKTSGIDSEEIFDSCREILQIKLLSFSRRRIEPLLLHHRIFLSPSLSTSYISLAVSPIFMMTSSTHGEQLHSNAQESTRVIPTSQQHAAAV